MLAALFALVGAGAPTVQAQNLPVGDAWEEYIRVLQASGVASGGGSFTIRPVAFGDALATLSSDKEHPWRDRTTPPAPRRLGEALDLTLADPGVRLFFNSAFPDGQNDGPIWQGRGLTMAMDAGATLNLGPLTIAAHPTAFYSENREFDLVAIGSRVRGMPVYAYPWRRIDLPQRFGPDPFVRFDPGNSFVRLDLGAAAMGFSTESLWWGPGVRNAIIMSNNAGGVPHTFLGTGRPVESRLGRLEAQWIFGWPQLSEWFDTTFVDPGRYLTGAAVTYSPTLFDGLTLGAARIFYALVPEEGIPVGELFLIFQTPIKSNLASEESPGGNDDRSQLFSLWGRWVLPESGFEVWVEWARNDHADELLHYFLAPEASQAYIVGFRKVLPLSDGRLFAFTGELTHLERTDKVGFGRGSYYSHHLVTPGYTHRGQVIGSGLGPGGNAQFLGGDLFAQWGKASLFVQRRVHDADASYGGRRGGLHASLDVGAGGLFWAGDVEVGVHGMLTRSFNRSFDGDRLWNTNLQLSGRWRPR